MANVKTLFVDYDKFNASPDRYMQILSNVEPFDTLSTEDIKTELQNETYFCILLADDQVASICRTSKIGEDVYINRPIVTEEEFRGKGYATKCLLANEKYLQKLGCNKIVSYVDIGNIASWKLHIRAGYIRLLNDANYRDKRYCWDTAVVFEKALTKTQNQEMGK